jgi:hypothetical protein
MDVIIVDTTPGAAEILYIAESPIQYTGPLEPGHIGCPLQMMLLQTGAVQVEGVLSEHIL